MKITQKSEIFGKIRETADDHNFGTEYARFLKLTLKCAVLNTLTYSTKYSISTKNGFRTFWKSSLHMFIGSKGIIIKSEVALYLADIDSRFRFYFEVNTSK